MLKDFSQLIKKVKLKKSLSQVFLKNKKIAERIVDFLELKGEEIVLEIGVGDGILTEYLIKKAKFVYGVEIDKRLVDLLIEKFRGVENLQLICQDILQYDISDKKNLIIVGNIPFNISTPLIFWLLKYHKNFQKAILSFQKEFALRLLAKIKNKNYSPITILTDNFFIKKSLFVIDRKYFFPPPKVSTMVMLIIPKEEPLYKVEYESFFKFLRIIFSQRRKKLLNIIVNNFGKEKLELLKGLSIDLTKRPEEIELKEFYLLFNHLAK
ncbi:MAG: 16S rRNA (adenine(1518)-N(6)/adenine(1519)-N(6))-dimethyltransferase RsmA [candidate division WOR-3 bacterium]|nr:16S rRNA (adenine(1518)-N(6)/adenine(1519)-N(6))-dimethyltransferase RsmA [candidate division WOR-3 bacterium]MCX7837118.1 16S rRNA (adenine(1518)-N(6)/adenine(1519)-N(6))-dimethyltransferase RsmA [candidate division WOR-3 bacterium]MDW8113992.1 16S rRNA (adenine(1518)-N(6)/adenine(1519)-N(6))-dimethyltransferase RsmA [candidate division WOR-3 bacterium]